MGFIENLNKYGKKIDIEKTQLYKNIEKFKSVLEGMGLSFCIKNDYDLFEYEIIYNGLLNQNYIENTYQAFLNQNYDLLDYLIYEEKQRLFNNEIVTFLNDAPHFYDKESQTNIYIPYFEPFINKRFTTDYQMFMLKQHGDYIKNYHVEKDMPFCMYGKIVFQSSFSSLENVYEDERHLCLYYDHLKILYIYKKYDLQLINKLIIVDESCDKDITLEDIKIIAYDIENYLYKDCLEYMYEKQLICQKTYKKVLKSYQ